jgi:hypothetical protein
MHLYSGMTENFVADATRNRIASKLEDAFFSYFRYRPSVGEVKSWQNSLRAMATAVELGDLRDNGIVVELQLPLTSRRLDCMLMGRDEADRAQAAIAPGGQLPTLPAGRTHRIHRRLRGVVGM